MKSPDRLTVAFRIVLALITCFWLFACSVDKQARKKTAWLIVHDRLDDVCARIYPPKDSLVVRDSIAFDTLYVEQEVFVTDTVEVQGKERIVTTKCPPHQVVTKTVRRDSIIYRTNTADVDRMRGEVLAVQAQLKEKDSIVIKQQQNINKDNWWKVACLITWFAVLGMGVFRFFILKKPI